MKEHFLQTHISYSNWQKGLLALMTATYLAGIVGLQLSFSLPYFIALTPFNLLLSAGILLAFHTDWSPSFLLFCLLSYFTGFFVEVAGVASGLIFGQYEYGETLGVKWWNVPLIIGLNWFMLIYCTGIIGARLRIPLVWKAAVASSLMVLLDLFIEPVAIAYDFWSWGTPQVPVQNYVAWFGISFCLHLLFYSLPFRKKNPAAKLLYLLQLIFFLILCLFTIY